MQVIAIVRQRRLLASAMSFLIALVFATAIANVVENLSDWPNLMSYCAGFAVGSFVGLVIQERFSTVYDNVIIIAEAGGHELAAALRERGYGVTESLGEGRSGEVTLLYSVVTNRDLPDLLCAVQGINPKAFVTVDELKTIEHAWIRPQRR